MAGVVPRKLAELSTEVTNGLLTALILTKTEPRVFLSKENNEYRGVITYTVRDSKRHLVNCKCWGSRELIEEYHRKLKIYDIIDIISPRVLPALCATSQVSNLEMEQATRFQPLATLPYALVLNEGQGRLDKHDYRDMDAYRELRNLSRVPHKPLCGVLNVEDVRGGSMCNENAASSEGQFVDLLVVVAALRPVKELRSARNGQLLRCQEVIVFDRSCVDGMILTIWHTDWIRRAQQYWQPTKTILHLIDVKAGYSEFYKCATLSINARTIVYEDPICKEAEMLAQYAATVANKDRDVLALTAAGSLPEPNQITQQMTVKQIYARTEGHLNDTSEQFTAILYAIVTKFDLDGQSLIASRRCKSCHRLLPNNQALCDSDQCQLAFSLNYSGEKFEHFFNINMHFSDHTGTLVESRLSSAVAERLLNLTIEQFSQLPLTQKEQLKWQYLMNHVEVKLLVKKQTAVRRNLTSIVVDMRAIHLNELAKNISVF